MALSKFDIETPVVMAQTTIESNWAMGVLVLLIVAVAFFIFMVFFYNVIQALELDRRSRVGALAADGLYEAIEREYNGVYKRYSPEGKFVLVNRGGVYFRVRFVEVERGRDVMRITGPWDEPNFRMTIFPAAAKFKMARWVGMQDVEIGDSEFDRMFYIQTNDPYQIRLSLTSEIRQIFKKLLKQNTRPDFVFQVCGNRCVFEKSFRQTSRDEVLSDLDLFFDAYFNLDHMPAGNMLEFLSESGGDETPLCMVCGCEIFEQRVDCSSCETAHHRECWDYIGACSTYACGELNFANG